jgi:hypothetical protein
MGTQPIVGRVTPERRGTGITFLGMQSKPSPNANEYISKKDHEEVVKWLNNRIIILENFVENYMYYKSLPLWKRLWLMIRRKFDG